MKYSFDTRKPYFTKPKKNRAGILPYFIKDDGTVLVYLGIPNNPKFGGYEPQLLKGCIDEGESKWDAALREAFEEGGLYADNIIDTFKLMSDRKTRLTIYACRIEDRKYWDDVGDEMAGRLEFPMDEYLLNIVRPWQRKFFKRFLLFSKYMKK